MKDYSELTDRIYMQLSPELSQEFHNMLTEISKELSKLYEIDNAKPSEALMFIQELLNISETEKHFINLANYDTRLNLIKIKQALQRLEEIENAKSSEALEKLKANTKMFDEIAKKNNHSYKDDTVIEAYVYHFNNIVIEKALTIKSKKELAFDIIKEKCVDIGYVEMCFMYLDYNSKMNDLWGKDKADKHYLTEQEFNLLKNLKL